jgi:hypothetical protein
MSIPEHCFDCQSLKPTLPASHHLRRIGIKKTSLDTNRIVQHQKVAKQTLPHIMSSIQDSAATAIATQPAQPKTFFSLPGELRNNIYDILHQHTESTRLYSLRFRYPALLAHARLISRQFKAEFDKRVPTDHRLVISQTSKNQHWYPSAQPLCLPAAVKHLTFLEVEVNFDVCDTFFEPIETLLYFDSYSKWLEKLYNRIPQLLSPARGGQLHLRLSFNYASNLERIQNEISLNNWYNNFCTTITLIYDGDELTPGKTVATKSPGSAWETDKTFLELGNEEWIVGMMQEDLIAGSE